MTENLFFDSSGRPVDPNQLPFDSLCLARGVFETILFVGGKPAFQREHEDRLRASCRALSIATADEVKAIMHAAAASLAASCLPRLRVRVSIFAADTENRAAGVVTASPAPAAPASVRLGISRTPRFAGDFLAGHKTAAYLANLAVRQGALAAGNYDDLIIDTEGNVAETSTANVFFSLAGHLVTPSLGCILPGIVRNWVLLKSRECGIPADERRIRFDELPQCEAAFITNSIIGLVAVSRIGGSEMTAAAQFPWFQALDSSYNAVLSALA